MAAGCSLDKIDMPSSEEKDREVFDGELYLSIVLSSSDSEKSRAADDFVNYEGFSYESQIVNGKIFIYEGASSGLERDAVCVSTGDFEGLTEPENDIKNPDGSTNKNQSNVEFSSTILPFYIKLKDFAYNPLKDYYAMVVLNANETFIYPDYTNNQKFENWAWVAQENKMCITSDKTYIHPNYPNSSKSFYKVFPTMTNATGEPKIQNSVNNFKPTTLVKIDHRDFRKQIDKTDPIYTKIYMQRNVARVEVKPIENAAGMNQLNYEEKEVKIGPNDEWRAEVNLLNWKLDVVNKHSYPIMNVNEINDWKSYWHKGWTYERCLWVKDPNYDNPNLTSDNFLRDTGIKLNDVKEPQYCPENTFNTECQLQGQTTRAIIIGRWAHDDRKVNDDKTLGGLLGKCDEPCFTSISDANAFYMIGNQDKIWCRWHIEEALQLKAKEYFKLSADNPLTIIWKSVNQGGYFSLNDLLTVSMQGQDVTGLDLDEIAKGLNLKNATNDPVSFFYDRRVYYVVRIPHFDPTLVPWDEDLQVKMRSDGVRVADYKEDVHLGRYGIVRNFSYTISVKSIHKMGYPKVPDIDEDYTDDMPEEKFIDIELRVNSWARQDIDVTL